MVTIMEPVMEPPFFVGRMLSDSLAGCYAIAGRMRPEYPIKSFIGLCSSVSKYAVSLSSLSSYISHEISCDFSMMVLLLMPL